MSKSNVIGYVPSPTFTVVDIQQSGTFTQSRTPAVSSSATPYDPTADALVDLVWLGYVDGDNTEGAISVVEVDGSNNILNTVATKLVAATAQEQLTLKKVMLEAGKTYAVSRRTTQGSGRVYVDDGYLKVYQ